MKKLAITSIAVFLSVCFFGIQAQTTQPQLNQIELLKQLQGSWKCDITKDTTEFWDGKSFGTGVYADFKYVSRDKIILEGKQLYGYDKKADKIIFTVLIKGMDIQIGELRFTANNVCEVIPYSDILKLEKAPYKAEVEFKSADIMLYKTIVNNKIISTNTFFRVKN